MFRSLVKCGIAESGKKNVESKNVEMLAEWRVKRECGIFVGDGLKLVCECIYIANSR